MTNFRGFTMGESLANPFAPPTSTFIYGHAKLRKTTWVLNAAAAGFKVLVFNGENNLHTARMLKPDALARIYPINCSDVAGKPVICKNMAGFLRGRSIWNADTNDMASMTPPIGPNYMIVDVTKLDPSWVLHLDTYTALAVSARLNYAEEKKIDLSDGERQEWEGYNYEGNYLTWALNQLRSLPCHVVIVGHAITWEKRGKPAPGKKIGDVISTRVQMQSSSNNHASTIPAKFNTVMRFFAQPKIGGGDSIKIDIGHSSEAEGGSSLLAPGVYDWEKLQFTDMLAAAGYSKIPPEGSMAGLQMIPAGQPIPGSQVPALPSRQSVPIIPTQAGKQQVPTMSTPMFSPQPKR